MQCTFFSSYENRWREFPYSSVACRGNFKSGRITVALLTAYEYVRQASEWNQFCNSSLWSGNWKILRHSIRLSQQIYFAKKTGRRECATSCCTLVAIQKLCTLNAILQSIFRVTCSILCISTQRNNHNQNVEYDASISCTLFTHFQRTTSFFSLCFCCCWRYCHIQIETL